MCFLFAEFIVIHNGIITNYKDLKKFLVSFFVVVVFHFFIWYVFRINLFFLISIGEQRLWVWVRDWHGVYCQADKVHVWQPGEWWPKFCHIGWTCYPATGRDPPICTSITKTTKDSPLFNVSVLPPARRGLSPWSSRASITPGRPLEQGEPGFVFSKLMKPSRLQT